MLKKLIFPFLRWCPGALGFVLRQKVYPRFLKTCGHGVVFGRFIDMTNPHNITLGNGVVISNRAKLLAGTTNTCGTLEIGDKVFIGIATEVDAQQGSIIMHKGANIGSDCVLRASDTLLLEENVLIAAYCQIGTATQSLAPEHLQGSITIGAGCWLGARSQIRISTSLGENSIIGAHAVASGRIASNSLVIGNPGIATPR